MKEETQSMNSKRVGNVIICFALLILLTGIVSADIVHVGSSIDATLTSVTTHLGSGIVSADADSPITLNYDISAKGITRADGTTVPMSGSVTSYVRAHVLGGRNGYGSTAEDLTYSDITRASGLISSYQKSIAYRGGTFLN